MKNKMNWSEEQRTIFANKHKNMVINADAGSGKTTVLFELIKLIKPKNALMLSFNRDIAEANKKRAKKLGVEVNINTFHSYGYSCFPKKAKIDVSKLWYIVSSYCKKFNMKSEEGKLFNICSRLRGIGYVLNVPYDKQDVRVLDITATFVSRADIKVYEKHILTIGNLMDKAKSVDFDDLCDYPVRFNYIEQQNIDLLLVDEIQDLNIQQISIIDAIIKANGCQFIGVGDSKQAIFGFRGAINAMELVSKYGESYTLGTTYRCPSNIMDFVNKQISTSNSTSFNEGGHIKKVKGESLEDILNGIMPYSPDVIISQRNSVLIESWAYLFSANILTSLKGTPIVKAIHNLIRNIKDYNWNSFTRTLRYISGDFDIERAELAKGILNLCKILKIYDRHHLMEVLDKMDKKGVISLETVHSFKGREAQKVAVICDWFSDKTNQLENVKYVAFTRAMNVLIVAKVSK